jgi:protein required for attachment to host cells
MVKSNQAAWWIVTADGSRARFFGLKVSEQPQLKGGPDLVEIDDLVNPEQWLRPSERFSNLKSGRNRAPGRGPAHGYDDHRAANMRESELRFARRLADTLCALMRRQPPEHLVLSADPRLLGLLRAELAGRLPSMLDVKEVAKDLSGLTRSEIHGRLADRGLVPRRHAPPARVARRA